MFYVSLDVENISISSRLFSPLHLQTSPKMRIKIEQLIFISFSLWWSLKCTKRSQNIFLSDFQPSGGYNIKLSELSFVKIFFSSDLVITSLTPLSEIHNGNKREWELWNITTLEASNMRLFKHVHNEETIRKVLQVFFYKRKLFNSSSRLFLHFRCVFL